jgi:hypothetical protein
MQLLQRSFEQGVSYIEYRTIVDTLYRGGKATGAVQSEAMVHYTELNIARMNKWDKHLILQPEVQDKIRAIAKPQKWLVLSEGWCGDAAHVLPVLEQLAHLNPLVELRIVFRDEHLALMDQYLTNGGRSIPKLIVLDEHFTEKTSWGPRPEFAQQLFLEGRANGTDNAELKKQLQIWYARNRGQAIQEEVADLVASS